MPLKVPTSAHRSVNTEKGDAGIRIPRKHSGECVMKNNTTLSSIYQFMSCAKQGMIYSIMWENVRVADFPHCEASDSAHSFFIFLTSYYSTIPKRRLRNKRSCFVERNVPWTCFRSPCANELRDWDDLLSVCIDA